MPTNIGMFQLSTFQLFNFGEVSTFQLVKFSTFQLFNVEESESFLHSSRITATEHAAGSYKHTTKRKEPSTWQRAATEHAVKTAKKEHSRSTAEHAAGSYKHTMK
jgi:hypothetical protein